MTSTAQLAVRPAAAVAPVAITRVTPRNRIAIAISGALLIVGTAGVVSTSLHTHQVTPQPASIVSVQLPTE